MPNETALWILFALGLALVLAWFQYFFRTDLRPKLRWGLGLLRFLSIFCLVLLLLNPEITSTETTLEKPVLTLAVDRSSSIEHVGGGVQTAHLLDQFKESAPLKQRFEMRFISFAESVEMESAELFSGSRTDLSGALSDINGLNGEARGVTVFMTDGNPTLGRDPRSAVMDFEQDLIPVILGDTTQYTDVAIDRVNTNSYSFLNNRFPVEIMVSYSGEDPVTPLLQISRNGTSVWSQAVPLDAENTSAVIQTDIPTSSVGIQKYVVTLEGLEEEKNLMNNRREFLIEVIDERSSVLLVYGVLHPDIGALREAIEMNQQRSLTTEHISDYSLNKDYDLVLLYQPTEAFAPLLKKLREDDQSFWLITGTHTDWGFLNQTELPVRQEVTRQTQEVFPRSNDHFGIFQYEPLDFSEMPPLKSAFGETDFEVEPETLLFQSIEGVQTQEPLLAVLDQEEARQAFLLGEGIWRWRSHTFLQTGETRLFDELVGKLVQFLSTRSRQERLTLSYEPLYRSGEPAVITARYFDENYVFDPQAQLRMQVKNRDSLQTREVPLLIRQHHYEADLSSLPPGVYDFTVGVEEEGLSKSGQFSIAAFDVEKQFSSANKGLMSWIAMEKKQPLFYPDQFEQLRERLLTDDSYRPVQKTREKTVPLVEWYYLLIILVLTLSLEWFLRKYYGLI